MIYLALLIAFSDLAKINEGEEITIKGYLSKVEDSVILSPLPQVKSCCVHKTNHLKILSSVAEVYPYKVVTVTGMYEKGAITPTRVE